MGCCRKSSGLAAVRSVNLWNRWASCPLDLDSQHFRHPSYLPWSSLPSFEIFLHVQKEPEISNKQASPGGKCYHLSVCACHVHCVGLDSHCFVISPVKFSETLIHTNNSMALSESAVLSLSNWPIFNPANGFWMSDVAVAVANWPTTCRLLMLLT